MTYRDASEASLLRRNELARSLCAEEDLDERERIGARLAELDRTRRIEARKHLPVVARAAIASPCHETFETMLGEGAIRSCARCDREVFDLAQMTLAQVEALIASRSEGGKLCVRLRRRADGTMMFADCEVGARGVRTRRLGAAIAATVIGVTAAAIGAQPPGRVAHALGAWGAAPRRPLAPASASPSDVHVMGEMTLTPAPVHGPVPAAWSEPAPAIPSSDGLSHVSHVLGLDPPGSPDPFAPPSRVFIGS